MKPLTIQAGDHRLKLNIVFHGHQFLAEFFPKHLSRLKIMSVLVSCGCWNKVPQMWWLKSTDIYSFWRLEVLETGSSGDWKFWRLEVWNQYFCYADIKVTALPPGSLGLNLHFAPSSFWWLLAFLGLRLYRSSLWVCLHMTFSSVYVKSPSLLFLLTGIYMIMFRAHPSDNPG